MIYHRMNDFFFTNVYMTLFNVAWFWKYNPGISPILASRCCGVSAAAVCISLFVSIIFLNLVVFLSRKCALLNLTCCFILSHYPIISCTERQFLSETLWFINTCSSFSLWLVSEHNVSHYRSDDKRTATLNKLVYFSLIYNSGPLRSQQRCLLIVLQVVD